MAEKRILIVDDSFDLTRVLKTAIHTLDKSIVVKVVPSAEEGLLELSREPLDLLISDVRLPGISGLDFLKKVRKREKDLKIIMITGLTDYDLESKAKTSGADFFLRKPIEIPLFIDAVSSYLDIDITEDAGEVANQVAELPIVVRDEPTVDPGNISDTLLRIRKEVNAQTVYLLDENGKIKAQTGDHSIVNFEENWLPVLLPLLSAGEKFSNLSRAGTTLSIMSFRFDAQDVLVVLLKDYALVVVVGNERGYLRLPLVIDSLAAYQADLMAILGNMGVITIKDQTMPEEADSMDDSDEKMEEEDLEELEEESEEALDSLMSLLEGASNQQTLDPDQFWEEASKSVEVAINNPDVISYEQAEKLGLTPDDAESEG